MRRFSQAIGLAESWPTEFSSEHEMNVEGLLVWARSYLEAAELVCAETDVSHPFAFQAGPAIQVLGIAAELVLKCLLRGAECSDKELRKVGHSTYDAYLVARSHFEEVKFIELVISNSMQIATPDEIKERLLTKGEYDPDIRWRVFFDHLRLLDENYDRPFRARYVKLGPGVFPEPNILLIGLKILIEAMSEKLSDLPAE